MIHAPGLLGLFSLVVLSAQELHPDGAIPVAQAAWYPEWQATFSDVIATIRHYLWQKELLDKLAPRGEKITLGYADLARMMQAAAA